MTASYYNYTYTGTLPCSKRSPVNGRTSLRLKMFQTHRLLTRTKLTADVLSYSNTYGLMTIERQLYMYVYQNQAIMKEIHK